MRKHIRNLATGVFSLALIIFVIGSYVIVAQNVITGTWTSNTKTWSKDDSDTPSRDRINISFRHETAKGGRSQNGSDFAYADLRGLTYEQAQNGKASFSLAREAGTIECEGTFTNGKGSGTYRFTPSPAFIDGMKARGFNFTEDQLFGAVTVDVTMAAADDLKSAGLGPVDTDDLFKAVIFKVTSQFIAEMKATGFPNLGLEELVKARIFKVDANFVRQVHEMGFEKQDFDGLVKFRIFKVTPEFLTELKNQGFTDLSAEDVVKFRIFKVTPELLTTLKNEGFANLSAEEVVKFQIFKIDTDFIREAKAKDPNVTVEDLVQMKIGVRRK
jgi:hypothetical protein